MSKILFYTLLLLSLGSSLIYSGPVKFRRAQEYTSDGHKYIVWTGDATDVRGLVRDNAFKITCALEGPEQGICKGTAFGVPMTTTNPQKLFWDLEEAYEREKVFGPNTSEVKVSIP